MIEYKFFGSVFKKYMKLYNKCSKKNNKYIFFLYKIRLNKYGYKFGLEIPPKILDESCIIYHENVVINSYAKIGKNVKFHGNNCIGNNAKTLEAPVISDNVDIGFGAVIIGPVFIAKGCIIGANAVVVKSVYEENSIIVGNPGRIVNGKWYLYWCNIANLQRA